MPLAAPPEITADSPSPSNNDQPLAASATDSQEPQHHVVLVTPSKVNKQEAQAFARADEKGLEGLIEDEEDTLAINLSWEDLSYSIGSKDIISHMSGRLVAGRTCAVMGLSGCGKTTLLNALSGRLAHRGDRVLKGRVRLNDVPYDRRYRKLIGYIPQEDIIGPMSTPRTAFKFALRTRRGVSQEVAKETVHKYIERLNLMDCRNTIAGLPGVIQGLSGGERKRTNIGMELVADTKILLCDEPTSGLDSTTALMVVKTLQDLAHIEGCTVMFTAHQPTSEMIAHFDDILLMWEGKTVYHGPMDKSVDYFEALGYTCPSNFTPTDFYMVLLQNDEIAPQLFNTWQEYLSLHEITIETARSPMNNEPIASPIATNHEPIDGTDEVSKSTVSTVSSRDEELKLKDKENKEDDEGEASKLASGSDKGPRKGGVVVERTKTADVAHGDDLKYVLGDNPPDNVIPYPAVPTEHEDAKNKHHHHHHRLHHGHNHGAPYDSPTRAYLKKYLATSGSSYWIQCQELFKRAFVFVYTDYSYLSMLLISHLFFAVVVAIIFNNLEDSVTGLQDRLGVLFMCVINICFSHANFALNRFRSGKQLYIREQHVGAYSPFIFFLATVSADLPIIALSLLLKSIIVYFSTKLALDAGAFFYFFAVLFCVSLASFGLGALVGSSIDNEVIATAVIPMVQIPMLMCGGLLANNDQIRPYFIWMEKISYHRYGSLLLFHNEFDRIGEISCDTALYGVAGCALQPKRGPEIMPFLGFDGEQDSEWVMWISLAAFIFLVRFGQLIALYVIAHSKT